MLPLNFHHMLGKYVILVVLLLEYSTHVNYKSKAYKIFGEHLMQEANFLKKACMGGGRLFVMFNQDSALPLL